MSEQKTSAQALPQPMTGDWLSDEALQPLLEINGQCVDMLREMAQRADSCGDQPRVVAELRPLWLELSGDASRQMAACPFLLVDAGFNDELRWRTLQKHGVHDTPREQVPNAFAGELDACFVRRVLVYGWHLARAHRQVARVALGMSPACARRIGTLSLKDLDWIAEQPGWARLRWETQPLVWRQFLIAAIEGDRTGLQQVSLRGIQLMGAGVLARGGATGR